MAPPNGLFPRHRHVPLSHQNDLMHSYDIVPEYKFPAEIGRWPRRNQCYCGAVAQRVRSGQCYMEGDMGARIVVVNCSGEMCWWTCRKGDIPIGVGGLIL